MVCDNSIERLCENRSWEVNLGELGHVSEIRFDGRTWPNLSISQTRIKGQGSVESLQKDGSFQKVVEKNGNHNFVMTWTASWI